MPIFSVFKSIIGKEISIDLKQGITLNGTLLDVDTFLNLKLQLAKFHGSGEMETFPLNSTSRLFVRGSAIKFVWTAEENLSIPSLEDATRKSLLYKSMASPASAERDPEDNHNVDSEDLSV